MAAARLDAALWELHRPLQEAPDGAEPAFAVAPARLVKEVEECLNVENVEVTLARARTPEPPGNLQGGFAPVWE